MFSESEAAMCTARAVLFATMAAVGPAFSSASLADPSVSSVASAPPAPPDAIASASLHSLLQNRTEFVKSDAPSDAHATALHPPLSVVEIPIEQAPGVGPPARPHHGISMRFQAADQAMRSWGVDGASDCAVQLRMPSRVSQLRGTVSLDVRPQVRFGCNLY
jgi:hypothetical protein